MSKATATFRVRITTGDKYALFRALKDESERFANQAIHSTELTHDDDPDSDVQVSIDVDSLHDLRVLLNLVEQQKYISGCLVCVGIDSGDGIEAWATIGRDWLDRTDGTRAGAILHSDKRKIVQDEAIDRAIELLRGAL